MTYRYTYTISASRRLWGFIPYPVGTVQGSFDSPKRLDVQESFEKQKQLLKQAKTQLESQFGGKGVRFRVSMPRLFLTIKQ